MEPQAPFSRPPHGPDGVFDKRFPPPPHPLNAGRFSPNDFREPPPSFRRDDYWASLGLDGPRASEAGPSSMKRKYGEEDEFARHRQSVLQYGSSNPNGLPSGSGGDRGDFTRRGGSPHRRNYHDDSRMVKQGRFEAEGYDGVLPRRGRRDEDFPAVAVDVDPKALKRAFLKFAKIINENLSQRKNYLEDGKNAPLQCIVCGRFVHISEVSIFYCLLSYAISFLFCFIASVFIARCTLSLMIYLCSGVVMMICFSVYCRFYISQENVVELRYTMLPFFNVI